MPRFRMALNIVVAAVLGIVLIALGVVYGIDLLSSSLDPISTPVISVAEPGPEETPSTPAVDATTPMAVGQAAVEPPARAPAAPRPAETPTPEPGGRVLALVPAASDVAWWSSGQNLRAYTGDSFLYAGYFDDQVFVAALRLDISRAPRGAPLREVFLTLIGLNGERLQSQAQGVWTVQLLEGEKIPPFSRSDFQTVFNATADITLFPVVEAGDLVEGQANRWMLDAAAMRWLEQQIVDERQSIVVRLTGPVGGQSSLFAWDSGSGPSTGGSTPELTLVLGPAPATPPPTPTRDVVVATLTATPENVLTVAAYAETATAVAVAIGTYTPTPDNVVTPTPFPANLETVQAIAFTQGLPPVLLHTPAPQNGATREAQERYEAAVALTTGTFTPVPTDYVTPVLILPSPPAQNVATAAARVFAARAAVANSLPTGTPFPYNAVMAQYVYATPTPENVETVIARAMNATAIAVTTGTATPLPWYVILLQPTLPPPPPPPPTPTPTQLVVFLDQLTPTPTPTPTPASPGVMSADLVGKILFWSNREGNARLYALDVESGRIARLADRWPYDLAKTSEGHAPSGAYQAIVREDERRIPQVYIYDTQYNVARNLSQTNGWSYDPAWSPRGDLIAFVSQEPGNDEIYVVDPEGNEKRRLTFNGWEWDKHPSWSPDGSQIVFYSNRDVGRRQLWIMNVDGSNQRRLIEAESEEWDPVWVKP